jgi:predicted Zn-dependent protease
MYDTFSRYSRPKSKEGTVGTTKLTRKEITSEDPVHEVMVHIVEFVKARGREIGLAMGAVVILSLGIYGGLQYLDYREMQAQERLGKGLELFHALIAPDAPNNPYGNGPTPVFKSDAAKYQAAAKEFSALTSGYGYSKLSIVARYYLGLTQMRLGQKKEAIQNLETVANNSRNRIVGYIAKKDLARIDAAAGNYKRAREILDGMIKDPQCVLPKDDLSIELSHVLLAQGDRDGAVKILLNAGSKESSFGMMKQQIAAELDKLQKGQNTPVHP